MPPTLRASGLMVLSMLLFAFEDLFLKLLSRDLSIGEVLFWNGSVGALVFTALMGARRQTPRLGDLRQASVWLRTLGEGLCALTFVAALALGDLSAVSAIGQLLPLAMTMGGALILGEAVGWRRWTSVAVGFAGAILIIRPGTESFQLASVMALASVVAAALRDLATRRVPAFVSSGTLTVTAFGASAVAGLALMAANGEVPRLPAGAEIALLAGCVMVGLGGYQSMVVAVRLADLSVVAPFRYTRLIFALVLAVVVLGERPDALTLIGAAVIALSGIYAMWRETQIRRRQAARAARAASRETA